MISSITQSNDSILTALTQYGEIVKSNRSDLQQPTVSSPSASASSSSDDTSYLDADDATSAMPAIPDDALNLDMLN
jgi:hypothetical protein